MIRNCLLAAGLAAATLAAPAFAQAELADFAEQDYAYVAAQNVKFQQATIEGICKRTSSAKAVKQRFADFVAGNPAYTAALASSPTGPASAARAQALTTDYREGMQLVMGMATRMQPEMICKVFVSKPMEPFEANIEGAKKMAAMPKRTPPPADPDAALPEVRLSAADLNQIVQLVLEHRDFSMFLHPELAERIPVRVAFSDAYTDAALDFSMYGQPVRVVRASDDQAVHLTIRGTASTARVSIRYRPEGVHGTVRLAREGSVWRVTESQIFE